MLKVSRIAFAACACAVTPVPAAYAADLTPVYEPAPIPPKVFAGWYLRGDIGISNQQLGDLDNILFDDTDDYDLQTANFEAGPTYGIGIGYQMNQWLRFDVTGEYRGETEFHGYDTYTDGDGDPRFNDYTAKKSEWLALVNAYVDLGSWHGITPFVGAGVGMANVKISSFRDDGVAFETPGTPGTAFPTSAYADDNDEWNFAWALYAGLGYRVTDNFTVEMAYRYLDMGDGESGDIIAYDGTNEIDNPMEFNDLTSHDVRLGVRYSFW